MNFVFHCGVFGSLEVRISCNFWACHKINSIPKPKKIYITCHTFYIVVSDRNLIGTVIHFSKILTIYFDL